MNAILRLHELYQKRGYTIRTGLQPWHFHCNSYRNLPLSSLFNGEAKLSAGGGVAFTEMFFFSLLCPRLAPRKVLIIGNAFGLSSVLLALLNPNAKVVAIDAGVEGVDNDEGTTLTRRIAAEENLNLEVVNGFSPADLPNTVDQHLDGALDFVFVDGMHTDEQQTVDFNACWPYGGQECVYVFHDVLNYRMTASFAGICEQHKEMRGDILWRTPSGMALLSHRALPPDTRILIDLFTQTPEMIELTKREVRIEKYISLPFVRSIPQILPPSAIRWLRRTIYSCKTRETPQQPPGTLHG